MFEHELEMAFEGIDVRDLVPRKVRSQQMPAVSPALSICIEDAMPQEWCKARLAVAEAKVFELEAQYRLDIFGLAGRNDRQGDAPSQKRVSKLLKSLLIFLQHNVFLAVASHHFDHVDAKERVLVEPRATWFAAILLDETLSCEVESYSGVENVGEEGAYSDEDEGRVCHGCRNVVKVVTRDLARRVEVRFAVCVVTSLPRGATGPLLKESSMAATTPPRSALIMPVSKARSPRYPLSLVVIVAVTRLSRYDAISNAVCKLASASLSLIQTNNSLAAFVPQV
jgi:hypothetical protein